MKSLLDAIKADKEEIIFNYNYIQLNKTCGIFATFNPGYLGRTHIPENLRNLFRGISVYIPDLILICENMLMAEGFINARELSKKIVCSYNNFKEILSKNRQYDWGLRSIKSTINLAGVYLRNENDFNEEIHVLNAIRDCNLSKIINEDYEKFEILLGDIFPKVGINLKSNFDFEDKINESCNESNLVNTPEFMLKINQLKQILCIRHCVFVTGNSGTGKTTTWKVLIKAKEKEEKKIVHYTEINPKTINCDNFYGRNYQNEWKDGVFTKALRNYSFDDNSLNEEKWIILDGDLDANWIESLNSIMDDNKILTLSNGHRIPLKPFMRIIFEIRDLNFATPASVSRAGIVYISDEEGYQCKSIIKSWVKKNCLGKERQIYLQNLFDRFFIFFFYVFLLFYYIFF